jgi:hypothetical protein
MPVIPATSEVEIGGSRFKASPGKEVSEIPISTNKPGVVMHTC